MIRHKFNAVKTEVDGIKFSSKLEAKVYHRLKMEQAIGKVLFFHRQVPIDLPGKTRYFCDFQVFYADGSVEYLDAKGVETPIFKLKAKQVEALYPFKIKLVNS